MRHHTQKLNKIDNIEGVAFNFRPTASNYETSHRKTQHAFYLRQSLIILKKMIGQKHEVNTADQDSRYPKVHAWRKVRAKH